MKRAKPKWSTSRGWAFVALFSMLMALGACADSKAKKEAAKQASPTTTVLPFANGNGVPELTGVPKVAPNPVQAGNLLTVTLPVDADTGYVSAVVYRLFTDAGMGVPAGVQQGAYPTPGTAGNALLNVAIDSTAPSGSTYWVQGAACTSAANCSSSTGTLYTSISGAASYAKVPYVNNVPGTAIDTGVAIPTFSVACNTVLASDGAVGAPMAVTVPACGHVDAAFNDSFYVVTAAGGETLVTLTNLSDDVDPAVYTDATFTTLDINWLCSFHVGTIPDTCSAIPAVGPGPVYIRVFNYTGAGGTYTLNLKGPPPLPGNSVVSVDVPVPIPDFPAPAVTSTLTVSSGPTSLTRVAVKVNITHTYDSDLTLTLISPTGTQVVLSFDNGTLGDNYTNTVFMDGTGNLIDFGTAPFTGNFDPEQLLAEFAGENANGTWSLKVVDDTSGDTGTIDGWTLYFE